MSTDDFLSVIDAYKRDLAAGQSPEISSFLERADKYCCREELLAELIRVDLTWRHKYSQQTLFVEDYDRFGEDARRVAERALQNLTPNESFIRPNSGTSPTTEKAELSKYSSLQSHANVRQIGPYKLLQQIGEGGMGSVWMAEQKKPVRRRVALKLIKGNLVSKEIIARFEAERQALAMMNHQNIAKVLDVGTTESGTPYFVMELVMGVSITEFCDKNKLSIKDRLELFLPVCKAIQHAHHKGVIHRDLKPSNVLVSEYDGEPVPKVIDFGLAKAIEHTTRLSDKTMFTEFGKIVGTLQYMSPEQAEMNALDVDTRTDIYSLGVMLYELLAGSTPLDEATIGEKALLQVLEIVREKEPPRPSSRLSSMGETASGISSQRNIAPRKLRQILKGELDWIVMKSLEKNRSRRYGTAAAFADDIISYLNGDAVIARPASSVYKLKKFAIRNYRFLLAGGLLAVLLTFGLYFGIKADHERKLRKLGEKKNTEISRQRDILEYQEYINHIQLAQLSWNSKDLVQAKTHLHLCDNRLRGWEHRYLQNKFNQYSQIHSLNLSVNRFALSADGDLVAFANARNAIQVIDLRAGEIYREDRNGNVKSKKNPRQEVSHLSFSDDNKFLTSVTHDGEVVIFELKRIFSKATSRTSLISISNFNIVEPVSALTAIGNNSIAIATLTGVDSLIRVMNLNGKTHVSIKCEEPVNTLAASANVSLLAADQGERIILYDYLTGNKKSVLRGHRKKINSLDFCRDGENLASASDDTSVRIWSRLNGNFGQKAVMIAKLSSELMEVTFGQNGRRLTIIDQDGKLLIFKTESNALKIERVVSEGVLNARLNKQGNVVTTKSDQTVCVSNSGHLATTKIKTEHQMSINEFVLTKHGAIVSVGDDRSIIEYALDGKPKSKILNAHSDRITSIAYSSAVGKLATISPNGELRLWDAKNLNKQGVLVSEKNVRSKSSGNFNIVSVCFSRDGRLLAATGESNQVSIWRTHDLSIPPLTLRSNSREGDWLFSDIKFLPSGDAIAVAKSSSSSDKGSIHGVEILRLDNGHLTDGKFLNTMPHSNKINRIEVSPDGKFIASGGRDRQIKIWALEKASRKSTSPYRVLKGHVSAIDDICFSPNSKQIVTCAKDMTVKVWDLETSKELLSLSQSNANARRSQVRRVQFDGDGKKIIGVCSDKSIIVWQGFHANSTYALQGHENTIMSLQFNPNAHSRELLSVSNDHTIRLWDLKSKREVKNVSTGNHDVYELKYRADGKQFATADAAHEIRLWDSSSLKELKRFRLHQESVNSLDYSSDGSLICSGDSNGDVIIWETERLKKMVEFNLGDRVTSIDFSPLDKFVFSSTDSGKIYQYSTESGINKQFYGTAREDTVVTVQVSDNGYFLAAGLHSGNVLLWDLRKSELPSTLIGHSRRIRQVSFTPDSRFLATCGLDKCVKIWDVENQRICKTFFEHRDRLMAIGFSPDGRELATGGFENLIRIFDASF